MKVDFSTMTKEEALEYCYNHANQYKSDCYTDGENGEQLFECLISILEDGTIIPSQLPEYGMDYEN